MGFNNLTTAILCGARQKEIVFIAAKLWNFELFAYIDTLQKLIKASSRLEQLRNKFRSPILYCRGV